MRRRGIGYRASEPATCAGLILTIVLASAPLTAQSAQENPRAADPKLDLQAPTLPATFIRGDVGRSTVRAVRLTSPLTLDGDLSEEVYQTLNPAFGFFRVEPTDGRR